MNDSRERQLARFRANLHTRVRNLTAQLEVLEYIPSDPEAKRQVQGELHTLKGESRMLGLLALSDLAHRMEAHLAERPTSDFELLGSALQAIREALAEGVAAATAEEQLTSVLASLFGVSTSTNGDGSPAPEAIAVTAQDAETAAPTGETADRWIQVNATRVDELCERMSDLAASFGRLLDSAKRDYGNSRADRVSLLGAFTECRDLLSTCVDHAWGLRLVPIAPMLGELERHARLQAHRQGKEVDVEVHSGGAQLERDVVDQVWDTLLHLVQNAVAHGIEPASERGAKPKRAKIQLSAESSGSSVAIRVADDGRGIDFERVHRAASALGIATEPGTNGSRERTAHELIFRHGLSTQEEANDLAGRGVGLSVVKNKIEALGGSIELSTKPFEGTAFTLNVPFTITKERILVVEAAQCLYGIPVRIVRFVAGKEELKHAANNGQELLRLGDDFVPLRSLSAALGFPSEAEENTALILALGNRLLGAKISRVVSEQDLIRRPAEPLLSQNTGVGASGLLDDGRLVLLLEFGFLESALSQASRGSEPRRSARDNTPATHVLIVDDSPVVTAMVGELLTSAGLVVEIANNGKEALSAIERREPELVLSDVEMPEMNGLELLSAIRRRSPTLPVVMLTTRGSTEDRQRASSLGANAYVLKTGFRSDVLLEVVGRFLPLRS